MTKFFLYCFKQVHGLKKFYENMLNMHFFHIMKFYKPHFRIDFVIFLSKYFMKRAKQFFDL